MYSLLKKFLFLPDPETAHDLVGGLQNILPLRLLKNQTTVHSSILHATFDDISFENPVGLAAGFDKNGEMIPLMESLGFGHLEVGSVTAHPCSGNPRPRIFRIPKDESLINRMGLPNKGVREIVKNLADKRCDVPIGINVAKNPGSGEGVEDYLETIQATLQVGSYFVLNLSCPNTPDGKTFEDPETFKELAEGVTGLRKSVNLKKPFYLKLSPDMDDDNLKRLVSLGCDHGFEGFVVGNTTVGRSGLKLSKQKLAEIGNGGLSGRALEEPSNRLLEKVYKMAGEGKTLIGVGGILDLRGMLKKLILGADLFQIYTGLIFKGPFFVKSLNRGLVTFCEKRGVKNFRELKGKKELLNEIGRG